MAATNFTPISLYYSTTASAVPTSGNLVAGELALNTLDEKLYFKNSAGTVKLLASNAGASGSVTSVSGTGTVNGLTLTGTVTTSGSLTLGGTLSGTASININGTVGATTPTTGAFTTVTASSNISADNAFFSGNVTLPLTGKLNFNGATATDYMVGPTNGLIDSYIASSRILRLSSSGLTVTGNVVSNGYTMSFNTGYWNQDGYLSNYSSTNGVYLNGNSAGWASMSGDGSNVTFFRAYGSTNGTPNVLTMNTAGSEKVRVAADGNVGIGTTSPATYSNQTTLTINGSNYGRIDLRAGEVLFGSIFGGGDGLNLDGGTKPVIIYAGSGEKVRVLGSGAVSFGSSGTAYGIAGQVLTSAGSGSSPTWAAAGGGSQAFVAFGSTGGL